LFFCHQRIQLQQLLDTSGSVETGLQLMLDKIKPAPDQGVVIDFHLKSVVDEDFPPDIFYENVP
jgi:hypothetical protein